MKTTAFSSKIFDSKVPADRVTSKERILGFLFGPTGALMLNMVIGSYVTVYYTDVLRLGSLYGGIFLAALPLISKILDSVSAMLIGQLIEKTSTKQGKARPWLLISAPLILISGILIVSVPETAGDLLKAVWVAISYNLYYSVAYQIYNTSHNLMMPLSTSNSADRDKNAIFTNVGSIFIPGSVVAIIFPMVLLPIMGVSARMWLLVFSCLSVIASPCILIEYYFTRERVTENYNKKKIDRTLSVARQIKAVFSSKYFVILALNALISGMFTGMATISKLYYCRFVLADYVGGDTIYTIYNAVGQMPIGFGVLFIVPLIKKFGKRNSVLFGSIISVVGLSVALFSPKDLTTVIIGMLIYAFGYIPSTYMTTAMLADTLDHIEYKSGVRVDGFAISFYAVIGTIAAGIGQSIFNMSLTQTGYLPPVDNGLPFVQSDEVKNMLIFMAIGANLIGVSITLILMLFYRLDKEMPEIKLQLASKSVEK